MNKIKCVLLIVVSLFIIVAIVATTLGCNSGCFMSEPVIIAIKDYSVEQNACQECIEWSEICNHTCFNHCKIYKEYTCYDISLVGELQSTSLQTCKINIDNKVKELESNEKK